MSKNKKNKASDMNKMKNNNKRKNIDEDDQLLQMLEMHENNDREYNGMFQANKNNRKNIKAQEYFANQPKYSGKKSKKKWQPQPQSQEYLEQDNIQDYQQQPGQQQYISEQEQQQKQYEQQEQQQEIQQEDGIKKAVKDLKAQRKKKSKLLEETINHIDEEDHERLQAWKNQDNQYGDPVTLKKQLSQFSKSVEIRVFSQKHLEELKRYPIKNYPYSQHCHTKMKEAEGEAMHGLQGLIKNYEIIARQTFGDNIVSSSIVPHLQTAQQRQNSHKSIDAIKLWQSFEQSTKEITNKLQTGLIQWSQKTTLLRNSTSKSHYNSLIMQTPVGQAQKALKDWQRVSKKCQLKRSPFRILFEPEQNIRQNSNANIYDDLDLVQELQKIYEQDMQEEDKQFRMSDTLKYLQNRGTKQKKDVDRKASKSRKIRFNVHPKLLNFMPSYSGNMLEARDEIVKNLFNKGLDNTANNDSDAEYIDM